MTAAAPLAICNVTYSFLAAIGKHPEGGTISPAPATTQTVLALRFIS